jgi:hypothetical protein
VSSNNFGEVIAYLHRVPVVNRASSNYLPEIMCKLDAINFLRELDLRL